MKTCVMPERRPGQETITIYVAAGVKERFKRLCSLKGTSMTEALVTFIETEIEENNDLLRFIESKLGRTSEAGD